MVESVGVAAVAEPVIHWPERFRPANVPVHVRNEMFIAASPQRVWAWLIREPLWPTWYANSSSQWIAGRSTDLAPGVTFNWTTFGVNIESCVREFVPYERIAWDGVGWGVQVYHAWLLIPQGGGCRVLTEECQHGLGARLMNMLLPHRMHDGHALWLKSLSIQCRTGMPPAL